MSSALEARGISTYPDNLVGHVEGYIENVEGMPLITKIKIPAKKYPEIIPRKQANKPRNQDSKMTEIIVSTLFIPIARRVPISLLLSKILELKFVATPKIATKIAIASKTYVIEKV